MESRIEGRFALLVEAVRLTRIKAENGWATGSVLECIENVEHVLGLLESEIKNLRGDD